VSTVAPVRAATHPLAHRVRALSAPMPASTASRSGLRRCACAEVERFPAGLGRVLAVCV